MTANVGPLRGGAEQHLGIQNSKFGLPQDVGVCNSKLLEVQALLSLLRKHIQYIPRQNEKHPKQSIQAIGFAQEEKRKAEEKHRF